MKIEYSESYLQDKNLIESGYAKKRINCFILKDCEPMRKERQDMILAKAYGVDDDIWEKRYYQYKQMIADENRQILEALNHKIAIGQYEQRIGLKECDVWFWCDCKFNTGYATESDNSLDLSYVTLTINKDLTEEQQDKVCKTIIETAKEINTESNRLIVRYKTVYDNNKILETAQEFYKTIANKFIVLNGMEGKIKDFGKESAKYNNGNRYGFVKKRCRKAYQVSNANMVNLYLSMNK